MASTQGGVSRHVNLTKSCRRILGEHVRAWNDIPFNRRPYVLQLDVLKLANDEPFLYDFIVTHDIADIQELFENVIKEDLSNNRSFASIDTTQSQGNTDVFIDIRFSSVPYFVPGLDAQRIQDFPKPCARHQIIQRVRGKIFSLSAPFEHLRSTKFKCVNPACSTTQTNIDSGSILFRMPGSPVESGDHFIGGMPCTSCGRLMDEDMRSRDVCHSIIASLILLKDDLVANEQNSQLIKILIPDDLASCVHLGERYEIYGHIVFSQEASMHMSTPLFKVLNILPLSTWSWRVVNCSNPTFAFPPFLAQWHLSDNYNPWSNVQRFCLHFGSHIARPGSFHSLKMLITLSLCAFTGENGKGSCLSILILGKDLMVPERLLKNALLFTEGSVTFGGGASGSLGCQMGREDFMEVQNVQAGSLILAKRSVCLLGEITKLKTNDLKFLHSALEQDVIRYRNPLTSLDCEESLNATVWAIHTISHQSKKNPDIFNVKGKAFPDGIKKLKDVFRLVVLVEDCSVLEAVTNFALCDHTKVASDNMEVVKEFIIQQKYRKVAMQDDALYLLKRYFVASRRWRNMCEGTAVDIPQSTLTTLCILAESHAKLSLRENVTISDAIAAIRLIEENFTCLNKCTSFWESCKFEWEPNLTIEDFVQRYKNEMEEFYKKLDEFINYYSADATFEE